MTDDIKEIRQKWEKAPLLLRDAARRRMPLGGPDAQALEGALQLTERDRDAARSEVARLRGLLELVETRTTPEMAAVIRTELDGGTDGRDE